MPYNSFQQIKKVFSNHEFIIVFDEKREVEGDFFILAENITAEKINFLFEYSRGLICIACEEKILEQLKIPLMVEKNENPHGTNFCVSVDAKKRITTGVSASDRAKTIAILANPNAKNKDLVIPGHTFPLKAVNDIKKRFGHTEAAVKLAQTCEKYPVIVICEIMNKQGEKANLQELKKLSQKFDIPITSLEILKAEIKK